MNGSAIVDLAASQDGRVVSLRTNSTMLASVTRSRHCSRNSLLVSKRGMCINVRPFLIDKNIDQHNQRRSHHVGQLLLASDGVDPGMGAQNLCRCKRWCIIS